MPRLATWLHFWQPGSCFFLFILISILTIRRHNSLWIKIWLSRYYCVISTKYSSLSRKMMFCPTQTTCVCILWHVQKVDGPNGHKYILSGPESQTFFLPIFRNCIVTLIVAFMCRFLHHRDMLKKKIIACLSFYQYLLFSNHKVLFSILFGSFNIRLHVHNHCKM